MFHPTVPTLAHLSQLRTQGLIFPSSHGVARLHLRREAARPSEGARHPGQGIWRVAEADRHCDEVGGQEANQEANQIESTHIVMYPL